jgi:rhodanese-related sulfurtransferase
VDQYVELMNNLNLPNPKMMDVAVPANMRVGLAQEEIARRGWSVSAAEAMALNGRPDVALVDLRERTEREKHGIIAGSLHAPYPELAANVRPGGMLHELARATGKRIIFYCAFGERSAMAVQAAQDAGSHRPAISRAASMPGNGRAGRSCTEQVSLRHLLIRKSRERRSPQCRIWLRNSLVRSCRGWLKKASGSFISMIWPASINTMRFAT